MMKNKLITSLSRAIPVLLLFILYFTDQIHYYIADDYVMNSISAGGQTGVPDEHLLLINVGLGYFLKALYLFCNTINWFGIMYLVIVLLCTYTLMSVLDKYIKTIYAICIIVTLELIMVCYLTFTVLAYMATGIALIKLIDFMNTGEASRKKKIVEGITIILLFLFGYMLRDSAFVTTFILIIPILCRYRERVSISKKSNIILVAVMVLCVMGAYGIQKMACSSEMWKDYYSYNRARAEVLDYPMDKYEERKTEFEKLSISENDYKMLSNWYITDKQVFSQEVLEEIDNVKKLNEKYDLNIISIMKGMAAKKEVWLFAFVCILFIYADRKNAKFYILQGVFTFGMVAATFVRQRPVLRVIVPLCILGIICMLYIFIKESNMVYSKKKKIVSAVVGVGCLCLLGSCLKMNSMQNKIYYMNADKYDKAENYAKQNKEILYVTDLGGYVYRNNQSIRKAFTMKTEDNVMAIGGWDLYNNIYYEITDKFLLRYEDRLLIDLVENKNIRYMTSVEKKSQLDSIEKFIYEHTNREVESKLEYVQDDILVYEFSYTK